MVGDDENDAAYEDDDTQGQPGTEGEGAEGQDSAGRDDEGDVSTERSDAGADAGASPSPGAREPEGQSRGGQRFQRLSDEVKRAREDADRARRELEDFRRQQWQQNQAQTEQEERSRMALMTPEERTEYRFTQHQRNTDRQLYQMQMQSAAMMDKATFDAMAVNNPVYRKYAAQVHERFEDQMRKGQPVDRVTILKHLLGELALDGAAAAPARRQARRRVEAQNVRPSSPKGDTERPGGRRTPGMSEAESRLKDALI